MPGDARAGHRNSNVLSGYLPLLVASVIIVAMVVLVPSVRPDDDGGSGGATAGNTGGAVDPDAVGRSASGWGAGVEPCEDRELQVESSYSPPCFTFSGDNGGATHQGVTEDTITVSYRHLGVDGHLLQTLSQLAGMSLGEDPEDLWRTVDGLVDYFNENFEFYGRRIELERFDGGGSLLDELLGAGQENANVDAARAADREAFADITGATQPYSEALIREGIVAIGAPYMSREWFVDRAPYAWSTFPDCTTVAEIAATVGNERIFDEPAVLAGGDLEGEPRRVGVVYPNNEQYVICGQVAEEMIEAGGHEIADRHRYALDLGQTDSNATSILAGLRDAGVTSVACGCDPMMVQALAQKAHQQNYHPEWFVLGVGFVDLDLVGQMVASGSGDQWSRAFGASPSVRPQPFGESEGYRAFRSVRPDEEPSQTVDLLYGAVYRLAIGIQMAGPELTPENYATGMFSFPESSGDLGTWDFGPDNFSGIVDARFVLWLPDQPSPFNGEPGTYMDTGDRFTDPTEAPTQDELLELAEELL